MLLEISPEAEARLLAIADEQGMSISSLVERLLDERDEIAAITGADRPPITDEGARSAIERGFAQSERGEVIDGETFGRQLLAELAETEHRRVR